MALWVFHFIDIEVFCLSLVTVETIAFYLKFLSQEK